MAKEHIEMPGGALFEVPAIMRAGDLNRNAISGRNDSARYDDFAFFEGVCTTSAASVLGTGTLATFFQVAGTSYPAPVRCPKGYKAIVTDIVLIVTGSTAWVSGTDVRVSDTASSPVDYLIVAASALTANAVVRAPSNGTALGTAASGITPGAPFVNGSGTEQGLVLRATGTFTAGSPIQCYVRGYFYKLSAGT